jgi:hypothetical protein
MSVLEVCEHVFTFVESRLDAWSEAPFSVRCPSNATALFSVFFGSPDSPVVDASCE